MTAWEYLVVAIPPFGVARTSQGESSAVDALNREGIDGWEAVGLTVLPDGSAAVLMKRPLDTPSA